jgi:hypothetical protein
VIDELWLQLIDSGLEMRPSVEHGMSNQKEVKSPSLFRMSCVYERSGL